jgi:hypothetical protein
VAVSDWCAWVHVCAILEKDTILTNSLFQFIFRFVAAPHALDTASVSLARECRRESCKETNFCRRIRIKTSDPNGLTGPQTSPSNNYLLVME